eukprot:54970-Eustigmatos_ZCMA.PRE.1
MNGPRHVVEHQHPEHHHARLHGVDYASDPPPRWDDGHDSPRRCVTQAGRIGQSGDVAHEAHELVGTPNGSRQSTAIVVQ